MASLLQCVLPGCCSSVDPEESARLQLSLDTTRALALQVASLEEKLESLVLEVDELQQRYSTAPTTPSRRSPTHSRVLRKGEENYLPALLEMLDRSSL